MSCKNFETESGTEVDTSVSAAKPYPENLTKVFDTHGGLDRWKRMKNLCFFIEVPGVDETHTVSLPNRLTKIETSAWAIGYDGEAVWLLNHEDYGYQGNARFYHNLMFYFYAMPFVLADEGIVYTPLGVHELLGKEYNAFKISYEDGIGDSSRDEYILYSDPESYRMEWVGYTVTYRNNIKSGDWHFVKYDEWKPVNGLLLPKTISWYTVEGNKPKVKRNSITFLNRSITETELEPSVFKKPDSAEVVPR
ncbi:catalase [Flavobacteriaceae bacterium TK19130]|nr:catalase [Thermobacterium salinum]